MAWIWIAGETIHVFLFITIIRLPVSICIHLDIFTVWKTSFFWLQGQSKAVEILSKWNLWRTGNNVNSGSYFISPLQCIWRQWKLYNSTIWMGGWQTFYGRLRTIYWNYTFWDERSCATHSNASVAICRSKDSMDFSAVDFSLTGKFAAMHPAYPLIDSNCKAQKLFAMLERIVD